MTTLKHAISRIRNLRRAKGGWSIDAIGGLTLFVLLIGVTMYDQAHENDSRMATIAATHHKTVANAASAYLRDRYSTFLTSLPAVGDTTTVSFATLQANGYVQPTLSSTNVWGQTLNLRVRRSSTDPKAIQLEGLVIGEGGRSVPHEVAREVSQNIGAEGGYTVAAGDYCATTKVGTSTLCGTRGVWDRPVADFGAAIPPGHIASALFFKDGMQVNDYLYRHRVPGKPELNTMETYLQLGTGAQAVENQPCYSVAGDTTSPLLNNGAIATTNTGMILSCQGGRWRRQNDVQSASYMAVKNPGVSSIVLDIGSHAFCALSGRYTRTANLQDDCYVLKTGGTWTINLASSELSAYLYCSAVCFD